MAGRRAVSGRGGGGWVARRAGRHPARPRPRSSAAEFGRGRAGAGGSHGRTPV
jgi:hypothetical protein